MLERGLIAFGSQVRLTNPIYWACALVVIAAAAAAALTTGLWGIAGLVLGVFAIFAATARQRYERSAAFSDRTTRKSR